MTLKEMLPRALKDYIKLIRLKLKFPGRKIEAHLISKDVNLGLHCSISRDVEIGSGVTIGDYSYINAGTIIASGMIGKYCSIGYFCQIGMPDHPTTYISTSPLLYGRKNILGIKEYWHDYSLPTIIGHDVWIGSQSIIMQGVKIGDGAIIAAGALVNKDVSPYTIVGGIPAKQIRKRFGEEEINILLRLQWWNLSLKELQALKEIFAAGDDWKNKLMARNSF